jgi:alkylation response protein AidB-like acyl-CoA dehydrogenase
MAEAHRIKSEQEALEAVRCIAEEIRPTSGDRDRHRRLPFEEIEWFSQSGLWGITVPKEYGGAGVSTPVFSEVVALISEKRDDELI